MKIHCPQVQAAGLDQNGLGVAEDFVVVAIPEQFWLGWVGDVDDRYGASLARDERQVILQQNVVGFMEGFVVTQDADDGERRRSGSRLRRIESARERRYQAVGEKSTPQGFILV